MKMRLYILASLLIVASSLCLAAEGPPNLAFVADGKGLRFDTGVLKGTLRKDGKSLGLSGVMDSATGANLTGMYGLFSHYRLLDAENRYGTAAWDWASTAELLSDGAVEVRWTAEEKHPFDLKAVYRWKTPTALDVTTSLTAKKDLRRMEVFLASYFAGFTESSVYVKESITGKPGLMLATKADAVWHMFPRDKQAVEVIQDGRWKRPPHPVDWTIRPQLAGALAMRFDPKSRLTALVMTPPEDCFAVATPFGEEGHRSLYLCLFGRDVVSEQTVTARARLVIGKGTSYEQAIAIYEQYLKEMR